MSISKRVASVELLGYYCSMRIMVPGGEVHGKLMLKTALDCEPGISILGEAGLRHLQQLFNGSPWYTPIKEDSRYLLPVAGRGLSTNKRPS